MLKWWVMKSNVMPFSFMSMFCAVCVVSVLHIGQNLSVLTRPSNYNKWEVWLYAIVASRVLNLTAVMHLYYVHQ